MRLGIPLSTDFGAFSSFRRETCESTSLSALIFVPFQEQEKVWRGYTTWHLRAVRSIVSFLFFFFFRYRALSFQKEKRFGEGLLGENYNRIAAGGLGRLSPQSTPPPPP